MNDTEIYQELRVAFSDLKPNQVISLSDEAGKRLLELVGTLQQNGEL